MGSASTHPSASRVRTEPASNGCSVTVLDRPSLWNGSTPPAVSFPSARGTHRRWVAKLVYRLSEPAPDGRTELLLSPIQLLERLARFVTPPRVHRHRYHGVLAPNAKLRTAVKYIGRPEAETPGAQLPSPTGTSPRPQPSLDAEPARPTNPARGHPPKVGLGPCCSLASTRCCHCSAPLVAAP